MLKLHVNLLHSRAVRWIDFFNFVPIRSFSVLYFVQSVFLQFFDTHFSVLCLSLRKEVIQPQLPLQLPCYDFVPVTNPAFGSSPLAVSFPTSGITSSHDVTGGVYKARERIHRSMLTCGY